MFKTICLSGMAICMYISSFAQELKASSEAIKLDKETVAKVEKITPVKFGLSTFNLVGKNGEQLASLTQTKYNTLPSGLGEFYYTIKFDAYNDSVQMFYEDFYNVQHIPLFGMKDETFAKFVVKANLVTKEGAINKDGFDALKTKYSQNLAAKFSAKPAAAAAATGCATSLAQVIARDKTKPVVVTESKREETIAGKEMEITFEVKQADVLIATVVAVGHPRAARDERSEVDYAPGIVSLDGDEAPLNYTFKNSTNCTAATYSASGKKLTTTKDNSAKSLSTVLAKGSGDIQSRTALIQAQAAFLVSNSYL